MSTAAHDPHAPSPGQDAHDGHAHDPHLAHHFDTPEQQFSTGKLGMWTFLATEVLMFGGLFCAYAVYRYNHPEVYLWAHHALDAKWGMINTIVLLASSFTMAWGVRAAQLNQTPLLKLMLLLTFLGGVAFMGIKTVEYKAKWQHFLFPGKFNALNTENVHIEGDAAERRALTIGYVESHMDGGHGGHAADHGSDHGASQSPNPESAAHPQVDAGAGHDHVASSQPAKTAATRVEIDTAFRDGNAGTPDHANVVPPAFVASGINPKADARPGHTWVRYADMEPSDRSQLNVFFSIYFMMTGLHGIHVLVGMGIIAWLYFRAAAGEFSSSYFTPVDLGGLYWHLVDLIWIFLFPLLYLIH